MTLFFACFLIVVIFINILASISKRDFLTRIAYVCLVICAIIIASSQTHNNDYLAYKYYYNAAGLRDLTDVEIGFVIVSRLSRISLGLSYETFRLVFFMVMFSISGYSIWKLSKHPNLVYLLYIVLFFSVNITQIRYGMAEALVLLGILFLKKKHPFLFIICIVLGANFHISVIIFLVALLGYYDKTYFFLFKNRNKIIISSIVILIVMRVASFAIPLVVNFVGIVLGDSVRTQANFIGYDGNHYLKYLPIPFLFIALFKLSDSFEGKNTHIERFYEIVAYCSLYIYPIFLINRQLSRLSRTTVIICLIPFVEWLFRKTKDKNRFYFVACFGVFILYTFYCLSAYTSCLEPLLRYSILSEFMPN